MAITWNHPPNWPTPPQGWEPPDGWEPPADWPQPPTGWEFWVDDTPPVVAAPAAPEAFWSDDSLSPIPADMATPTAPPVPTPGFAAPPPGMDANSEQWSDSSLTPPVSPSVAAPVANGVDEDSYKPRWAVHEPADTPPAPMGGTVTATTPTGPTVATPPTAAPTPPPPPGGFMGGLAPDTGSNEEFAPPAFEGTFTPSSAGLAVAPADYSHIAPIGRQGDYTPRPVFPGNDLYLWLLTASPILILLTSFAVGQLPFFLPLLALPLPFVVSGVLGYLDLKQQAETGNPHKPPNLLWAIFLPPVYLALRRQHSGENQLPFFVYVAPIFAAWLLYVVLFFAMLANAMSGMSTSGGSVPGMDPNLVPPSSTGAIVPGP